MTPSLKRSRGHDEAASSPSALKKTAGSPSREYLAELSLQHDHYNKELLAKLEADEKRRGKSYREALTAAKAEHERIRRAAQRAQELNLLQVEKAKQQQENAEARELERQRHEQLEQEIADRRRRAQEAHRLEELRKQSELEKKQHDEEAKRREEREERERHEREVAEKQAKEKAQSEAKTVVNGISNGGDEVARSNGASAPATTNEPTASLISTPKDACEKEHNQYLDLHRWLKKMRKDVERDAKSDPNLKPLLGEWRREVRKIVGQLTVGKKGTVEPRSKILEILRRARKQQRPALDVRQCFAKGAPADLDDTSAQTSALMVYYLNILAKAVINQWANEGSAKTEAADPPGILVTFLFAVDDTKVKGHSLIDILLAKMHRVCPVVFGIYGNDKTDAGKARLGWDRVYDSNGLEKTGWATEQRHNDRMLGLGAGYASIALRDFSRAPMPNPYPPINYWRAIARIVNTPAHDITQSHLIVLKALIERSVERFAKFFRKAAQVALRNALIDFPKKAPEGPAKVGLTTLPDVLNKKHGIRL
ncbi:MAG: hypothetical protein Q9159_004308 [Coniocarpon cinnabarinum]